MYNRTKNWGDTYAWKVFKKLTWKLLASINWYQRQDELRDRQNKKQGRGRGRRIEEPNLKLTLVLGQCCYQRKNIMNLAQESIRNSLSTFNRSILLCTTSKRILCSFELTLGQITLHRIHYMIGEFITHWNQRKAPLL